MQNNKNLILAIVLSLAVVIGWSYLAEYFGLIPSREEIAQQQAQQQTTTATTPAENVQGTAFETLPTFTAAPGRDVIVETPLYRAVFYSGGAILRSFELKEYAAMQTKQPWIEMMGIPFGEVAPNYEGGIAPRVNLVNQTTAAISPLGLLVNGQPSWSTGKWSFDGENVRITEGTATLKFTGEVDGLRLVREFTFFANTYEIKEKIHLNTLGDTPRSARLAYTVGEDASAAMGGYYDAMRVAWDSVGVYEEETDAETLATTGMQVNGNISWAGAMSTYFMSSIAPIDTGNITLKARIQNNVYRVALEQADIVIQPGGTEQQDVVYWLGPKLRSLLEGTPNNLASAVDLGMFGIIGSALLWCLEHLQAYVHNWGIAIVLLTVGIKILFWPLTAKSYASMAKMRKIQPMIAALREKHGDDREALQKEMMNLHKTYNINPASGCVPMLVQLPVFFGLYQALLSSIELRGASFITHLPGTDLIWLADLSAADPFYITPLLMGASMFFMQKMSPPMGDPMQQKIMMFLPIIFTFMFLNFPSGLVLYWLVNNILSMAQQWMLLRKADAA